MTTNETILTLSLLPLSFFLSLSLSFSLRGLPSKPETVQIQSLEISGDKKICFILESNQSPLTLYTLWLSGDTPDILNQRSTDELMRHKRTNRTEKLPDFALIVHRAVSPSVHARERKLKATCTKNRCNLQNNVDAMVCI